MATSPSAAFLRLRAFIAERMRMSPIDQTLMLKELLGRRSPAPAHNVTRRILGSAWWGRVHLQRHHRLWRWPRQPDRRRRAERHRAR